MNINANLEGVVGDSAKFLAFMANDDGITANKSVVSEGTNSNSSYFIDDIDLINYILVH